MNSKKMGNRFRNSLPRLKRGSKVIKDLERRQKFHSCGQYCGNGVQTEKCDTVIDVTVLSDLRTSSNTLLTVSESFPFPFSLDNQVIFNQK